jgi:hypothetical protein
VALRLSGPGTCRVCFGLQPDMVGYLVAGVKP